VKGLDTEGKDVDEILEEVVGARRAGQDPKELFGGPRDWVDSMLPAAGFVVTYFLTKDVQPAVIVALAIVALLVVIRLLRKETLRHAFSGVVGVGVSALFAVKLGAKGYFLPGIVINVAYGLAFVASVVAKKPLVGVIMKLVLDKHPKAWHEHPRVRRAYSEASLMWASMFGLRFAVQALLYKKDAVGLLAATKFAMGYPLFLGLLAVTKPYVMRRTRDVPVSAPEGEAEPGGEDAADHAPEPVGDSGGA
jgi:hypothetical protein